MRKKYNKKIKKNLYKKYHPGYQKKTFHFQTYQK